MSPPHRALLAHAVALLACAVPVPAQPSNAAEDPPAGETSDRRFEGVAARPVVGIVGADALIVLIDGERRRIELAGVAEPGSVTGRSDARRFLENLLKAESVYVEYASTRRDDPGPGDDDARAAADGDTQGASESSDRRVGAATRRARIYRAPDGLFVNQELLRQGYAQFDARSAGALAEELTAAESKARAARKGVWARTTARDVRGAPSEPAGGSPPVIVDDPRGSSASTGGRSAAAAAPADRETIIVYVTKSGKKYHTRDCSYVRNGARPITLVEASKRYQPCSRCTPPE
jgi:endonuclease YncB( thermonuclease family)